MLSRILLKTSMQPFRMAPVRSFRLGTVNPYKHDPIEMSQSERDHQESMPVWERLFDHKKYMQHEGPLKVSLISNSRSLSRPAQALPLWMSSHSQG